MDFIVGMFALFGFLLCALIWLLPIILIAGSDKTYGGEKAAWILAVIFVSWFAWVFYLLLAPIKRRDRYRRGRRYDRYDYS
jgi:membrane protein YdbS with pleckstrin-like domain